MRWRLAVAAVAVAVVPAGLAIGALETHDGVAAKARASTTTHTATTHLATTHLAATQAATTTPALDPLPASLTISLPDRATGRRVPDGFLGLSFEFQAVRTYTGPDPQHINPVLVALIRNLDPGHHPVLRIGGLSTDVSYAPGPGVHPPDYVDYKLTPSWMASTAALARAVGAEMILGVNLVADQPQLAAAQARDYVAAFPRGGIKALEIGNEPNIYAHLTVSHPLLGVPLLARPRGFGYPQFRGQFQAIARELPNLTLAGPALAVGPTASKGSWIKTMPNFLGRDARVRIMTVHRYPLRNCYVPESSPQYPTIAHLLASYSTVGLADSLRRWIGIAHAQHRDLRVDEVNSVACRGRPGVSDTFASSLWSTDALFSLLNAGVDGVDVHTLPDSSYELFEFTHSQGQWLGSVAPVYYGLQLFAQAAPFGSRLLELPGVSHRWALSVWATRAANGITRVVLINKDPARNETVTLRPAGSRAGATLERMQAPGAASLTGVTLGGRSYGRETSSGTLPAPLLQTLQPDRRGRYTVTVPHASAALVTLTPAAGPRRRPRA